jgi:hypothetical protein
VLYPDPICWDAGKGAEQFIQIKAAPSVEIGELIDGAILSLFIVPPRAQASKPAPAKAGGTAKHKQR